MANKMNVPERKFTFLWKIKNFSYISEKTNECVTSSVFQASSLYDTSWYVVLSQRNVHRGTKHLYIKLGKCDEDGYHLYDWEYSFLDKDDFPIFTKTVRQHDFNKNRRMCNFAIPTCDVFTGPTRKEVFNINRSEYLPQDTLTLRLRLWLSEEQVSGYEVTNLDLPHSDEYFSMITVLEVDRVYIMWNIERFCSLEANEYVTNSIRFPNFNYPCDISFSLEGLSLWSSSARIKLNSNMGAVVIYCKVSLLDIENKASVTLEDCFEFGGRNEHAFPLLISRTEVLRKRSHYLKEDVLRLLIEAEVVTSSKVEAIYSNPAHLNERLQNNQGPLASEESVAASQDNPQESDSPKQNNHSVTTLLNDFLSLYRDKTLCDFELRFGDESFLVHKIVLCARSQFFREIITKDSEFYDVNDTDVDTLELMLTFLYVGSVEPDITWEGAMKLYYAAIQYRVQSLQEQCSSILQSLISISNVCELLLMAHKLNDDELKSALHGFILENVDEVTSSSEWNTFHEQYLHLSSFTLKMLLKRMSRKKRCLRNSPGESTLSSSFSS